MIEVEGRVLAGLDEFMLRIGHIAVLARVAYEVGASWNRIQRVATERLAAETLVPDAANSQVAEYLAAKELCFDLTKNPSGARGEKKYRYPDLEVYQQSVGNRRVRSAASTPISVSWQDFNLSHPEVRSRVGAISWEGKSGSKTGISHVCDWAQFLEIIDSSGRLSPIGRLIVALPGTAEMPFEKWNPYLPGGWTLFVAYEYLRRDLDLLAYYVPLISASGAPLQKAHCRKLFVEALRQTVSAIEARRAGTSRTRFEVLQQLRDLEKAAKRSRADAKDVSTAWHRAASRVETLTDLGFLSKTDRDEGEKYQYVYYPAKGMPNLAESFRKARSVEEWLDEWFVAVFTALPCGDAPMPTEELIRHIGRVVRALSLPTSVLPIDCLALGIVYQRLGQQPISFGSARKAIEHLPLVKPELARLSRGREGTRAEYISLNLKGVSGN